MRTLLTRLEEGAAEFKQFSEWYDQKGRYDRPHLDYGSSSGEKVKEGKPDKDGWQDVSGIFALNPSPLGGTGGIVFSGMRVQGVDEKMFNKYPKEAENALLRYVNTHKSYYEKELKDTILERNMIPYRFFGFAEMDEWEMKDIKLGAVKYGDAVINRFGEISLPVEVSVEFKGRRKDQGQKPLSKMSDAELDQLIWDIEGPEGVHMDGELRIPIKQRMKELRNWYRSMNAGAQQKTMKRHSDSLKMIGGYR